VERPCADRWQDHRAHVDAVQHSEKAVAAVSQQRVQPLAVLRRQDFLGIGLADRVDDVRKQQAPRHQVHDVVEVGTDVRMSNKAHIRQAGNFQDALAENPLVLKVMCRVQR
jgi:hypothetical protein